MVVVPMGRMPMLRLDRVAGGSEIHRIIPPLRRENAVPVNHTPHRRSNRLLLKKRNRAALSLLGLAGALAVAVPQIPSIPKVKIPRP